VPGYIEAANIALSYSWEVPQSAATWAGFATREDVGLHQQYLADVDASARKALGGGRTPLHICRSTGGERPGRGQDLPATRFTDHAALRGHRQVHRRCSAAADVFHHSTMLWVLESIRLDQGLRLPRSTPELDRLPRTHPTSCPHRTSVAAGVGSEAERVTAFRVRCRPRGTCASGCRSARHPQR